MPGRDRTGPLGQGPLTGRGMGNCGRAGVVTGFRNSGTRRFGMGYGRGRGWRNQFWATGLPGWARAADQYPQETANDENQELPRRLEELNQKIDLLNSRLKDIEEKQKD